MSSLSTGVKTNFFSLPREIRDEVYRNLLSTKRTVRSPIFTRATPHVFHKEITRTCRQISIEALAVLYQENTFVHVVTDDTDLVTDLEYLGLPCMTRRRTNAAASLSRHCVMEVGLEHESEPGEDYGIDRFIIAAEDLPTLCEMLWLVLCPKDTMNTMHLMFKGPATLRSSRDMMPVTKQRQLLSPFKRLWPIRGVCVSAPFDDGIATDLRLALTRESITPEPLVAWMLAIIHGVIEARRRKDFLQGAVISMQGMEANTAIARGVYDLHTELVGGPFDGKPLWQVGQALRFRLRINMSRIYEEMGQFYQAARFSHLAILESPILKSPLVTDIELAGEYLRRVPWILGGYAVSSYRGETPDYYLDVAFWLAPYHGALVRARAYQKLGIPQKALRDFEIALESDPDNADLKKERNKFRHWMRELDLLH